MLSKFMSHLQLFVSGHAWFAQQLQELWLYANILYFYDHVKFRSLLRFDYTNPAKQRINVFIEEKKRKKKTSRKYRFMMPHMRSCLILADFVAVLVHNIYDMFLIRFTTKSSIVIFTHTLLYAARFVLKLWVITFTRAITQYPYGKHKQQC